jgi:hypothetical protein
MEQLLQLFGLGAPPPGPPQPRSEGVMPFHAQRGMAASMLPPEQMAALQDPQSQMYYNILRQLHAQLPQTTRQYFRYNDPDMGLPPTILNMIYGQDSDLYGGQ